MPSTLAFTYDRVNRRADLAWPLRLDATPVTPALISLLCDRRARPDDPLPLPEAPTLTPEGLNPRRGWCGDALLRGGRIGSRLWLLLRAKQTEATRRRAEAYATEALSWAAPTGLDVDAEWLRPGVLAFRARLGRDSVTIERAVT